MESLLQERTTEAELTIRDLTNAQIEMKGLIDQERAIYNEERERLEEDVKRANIVAETKIRLIKTRLLALYEGDFEEIKRGELPVEELIERIASKRFKRSRQQQVQ